MDRRGRCNILAAEKSALHTTSVGRTKETDPLLLYITATHQVVSMVLVVERTEEGKVHGAHDQYTSSTKFYHHQNKTTLSTLPKTCVQCVNNSMEVTAVLRGAPNHSG
jgi:hypothetical protein